MTSSVLQQRVLCPVNGDACVSSQTRDSGLVGIITRFSRMIAWFMSKLCLIF
jgi:hypothetical protein